MRERMHAIGIAAVLVDALAGVAHAERPAADRERRVCAEESVVALTGVDAHAARDSSSYAVMINTEPGVGSGT